MEPPDFDFQRFRDFKFQAFAVARAGELRLSLKACVPASAERRWVPYYKFEIIWRDEVAGHIHFRVGHTRALTYYDGHIGYYVEPRFRGQRLAQRACLLLSPFIKQHGFSWVILTCNPNNIASRKSIEGIGARYLEWRSFNRSQLLGLRQFRASDISPDTEKLRYRWEL